MPTITVRISEEEKKKLLEFGTLSESVREALRLYLDSKKSQDLLRRLASLQKRNPIKTSSVDEVRLISEDRSR